VTKFVGVFVRFRAPLRKNRPEQPVNRQSPVVLVLTRVSVDTDANGLNSTGKSLHASGAAWGNTPQGCWAYSARRELFSTDGWTLILG
jgi:hypothetical protein